MTNFQKELCSLLNKYSREDESETPDFIIAEYLMGCLKSFNESVNNRELWYGRRPLTGTTNSESNSVSKSEK